MPDTSRLFKFFAATAVLFAGLTAAASAAEIQVLSAGAIEPGLKAAVAAFERQTGHVARITFNTAPELRKRLAGASDVDVVIAPPAVIADLAASSKLAETRAHVGRVGVGVAVRSGAPVPDISSVTALRNALIEADSLVFNRASTGLYLEGLFKRLDVQAQADAKATRYPDGAAVMEHVLQGKGREVGFGAITEILLYKDRGLRLVGPLPAEVQNYTAYMAAPLAASKQDALAQEFVAFLAGPVAKLLFVAAGVTD